MNHKKYNRNIAVKDWWERTAAKIIIISETVKYQILYGIIGFILAMTAGYIERTGLGYTAVGRIIAMACVWLLFAMFICLLVAMMLAVIYTYWVEGEEG